MANDTLTFELGGRVAIEDFEYGMTLLRRLVVALSRHSGATWVIEDLQPGSAITTLRGEAEDSSKVEAIVKDYAAIGSALERQEVLQYNKRVTQAAYAIKQLAHSIDFVRFETPEDDHTIYGNGVAPGQRLLSTSIGAITGRVQTLSNRGSLRFNLYDIIHDKAVSCYLQQGQEELMREAWGRRATVSGTISRESPLGRPLAIRHILAIDVLEDIAPGSYRQARGAVLWRADDKMPEDIIRQFRDA